MQSPGFDIRELVQEAHQRWLKPAEVLFILQNHENHQLTESPPQMPPSGSLFLFNKRVLRFFRKDGHSWRKKRDGRTVGEAHERLKVGTAEALNCYYAHGEVNPNFQRRSYWMLNPAYEHIVLVHYRDINEGKHRAGSSSQGSPGLSYTSNPSPSFSTALNAGSNSTVSEVNEPYQSSFSPGSTEVSSVLMNGTNGIGQLNGENIVGDVSSSPELEVHLRRLEEQLSLNDDEIPDYSSYNGENNDLGAIEFESSHQDKLRVLSGGESNINYTEHVGRVEESRSNIFLHVPGDIRKQHFQHIGPDSRYEKKESPFWKETLELCSMNPSAATETPFGSENGRLSAYLTEQSGIWNQSVDSSRIIAENRNMYNPSAEISFTEQLSEAKEFLLESDDPIISLPQNGRSSESSSHFGLGSSEVKPDYSSWFNQETLGAKPPRPQINLTLRKQKFRIKEISPEYGYATENTKVIITGYFLCDPSESDWACKFGDIEVPVEIIQDGVLRCQAPPNVSGKVNLCITSGNHQSCSEVKEFEYLIKPNPSSCAHCNSSENDPTAKTTDELLWLARFAQILVSKTSGSGSEDPWEHIIDDVLFSTDSPSRITDRILQELLKDKLQEWLSSKCQGETPLSRKEQGIIHMVAGLGFEWALNPILESGVSVNFRDINGWTPLHWAARFGREKMVASLVASGASALAVTDPTAQDPAGKTAGFIAATSGHKGLSAYLSELALTSHLSSLTIEESEFSKGSAAVEAERTLESISKGFTHQSSLKDSLAAVRNSAIAAARIQSAFRAHSFRRRQQKESSTPSNDENSITQEEINELSTASKFVFRNLRDHKLDKAAVSIQKKYRGWKGHKDYVAMKQKVVKIQAHVRGYQARKKYKVFLWAVGFLDKAVLRWRRKGAGLRGFRAEHELTDEKEDEDILKVFRKQKVDVAIEEAVSQVLSMVESPDARQQYRRMLDSYRQAKAEASSRASEKETISQVGADMEADDDDDLFMFT
ncbi:hypothetical protein ACHQM5_010501 [Ranunculus cassubicifolius]